LLKAQLSDGVLWSSPTVTRRRGVFVRFRAASAAGFSFGYRSFEIARQLKNKGKSKYNCVN
jgi:hypothetical protein